MGQQLVEGFEDLSKVAVANGEPAAVNSGQGVTQGSQAAQIPPRATVKISVDGKSFQDMAWLRLDTFAVQPAVYPLMMRFEGHELSYGTTAYAQTGKDTIALPLSVVLAETGKGWPEKVTLSLTNLGDMPLIVDNLRLDVAAKPPRDSVLIDFGPDWQIVWPGFRPGGRQTEMVSWSGEREIQVGKLSYPDPLGGDFVGPLASGRTDNVTISSPTAQSAVAWLWVTHYTWGYSQPLECFLRLGDRVLVHKRLSPQQMLSPAGLLEGMDGEWTLKWFDAEYANHFVEVVPLSLPAGKSRLDLCCCQVAAIAMAPASARAAMGEYVDGVQKDLSRYRRQFVVGLRVEPPCDVQPTDAENRAGCMIFQASGDAAFSSAWKPADRDRLAAAKATLVGGGMVVLPLAVVPLKDLTYISASLGPLRSADGRTISANVHVIERVPRVVEGRVEMQPWILSPRCGSVKDRQIVYLAASVGVSPSTAAGVYRGPLRLNYSAGQAQLPVEVEVADLGSDSQERVAWGAASSAGIGLCYRALAESMTPAQSEQMTARIRQQLLGGGLNALLLDSPFFPNRSSNLNEDPLVRDLKNYPIKAAEGPTLVNIGGVLHNLANDIQPGSQLFQRMLQTLLTRTNAVMTAAGLKDYLLYMRPCWSREELNTESYRASLVRQMGGKAAVFVPSSTLAQLSEQAFDSQVRPFAALMLLPNSGEVAEQIAKFKKQGPGKACYLQLRQPDRYMMGFYARAVGASGCYVSEVFTDGSAYNGFHLDGRGLLEPQSDGSFSPTIAMVRLRQAMDDYLLMRRAEQLSAKAAAAGVQADDLNKVLSEIRAQAAKQDGVSFNGSLFRCSAVGLDQVEAWRTSLIQLAADLQKKLKGG